MSEEVTLKINDMIFRGWLSFSIEKSIESISSAFSLSVTDSWKEGAWPIREGDEAELFIGKDKIISGYVDSIRSSIASDQINIQVAGRDKTADIIDCSVDGSEYEYSNIKLEKLCTYLCAPFGLEIETLVDTGPAFPSVRINTGESVFEVLQKRVKQKGLLLIYSPEGKIQITSPGKNFASSAILEGTNLYSCEVNFDTKARFSSYKVKSQNDLDEDGLGGFGVFGSAKDDNVKRYRPLILSGETSMTNADAQTRAKYEAIVRAANAKTVTVTVIGFRQADDSLWKENLLVRVNVPSLGINNEELLITGVNYSLDNQKGDVTTLSLKRKDAFIPVPEVPEKYEMELVDE